MSDEKTNREPITSDDVIKFLRDSPTFRALVKDSIRKIEEAEAQGQKEKFFKDATPERIQCTCCPLHPNHSIPYPTLPPSQWWQWYDPGQPVYWSGTVQ